MRILCPIYLAMLLCAAPLSAQTIEPNDLDTILSEQKAAAAREAKLKAEREKIQGDISGLNEKLGEQVKTLSRLGADINSAQTKFNKLDKAYTLKKAALLKDQKSLSQFLGYIQRLERRPPSPVLTSPGSTLNAAQTALLIKTITRDFDQKSHILEDQIKDITSLRNDLITQQAGLEQKQNRVQSEENRLKSLVKTRREKIALIADEEKQARQEAAKLAAKAANLKELLEKLEQANKNILPRIKPKTSGGKPPPERSFSQGGKTKPFTQAKRELLTPVQGK